MSTFARDSDNDEPRLSLLYAYNALQVVGFFLTLIVLLTAWFSSKVRRTKAWYLFMAGWPAWCISHALIFGQQTEGYPPFGLCLFQAGTIYAGSPYNALLTIGILIQFYSALSAGIRQRRAPPWVDTVIVAVPIVVYVILFFSVIVVGLRDRSRVVRASNLMYCNLSHGTPATVSGVLVGIISFAMLMLEVVVGIIIFKNWTGFQRIRSTPGNHGVSTSMIVRISVFGLLPLFALGFSIQSLLTHHGDTEARVSIAVLPTAAALIFGTQQDIIQSWMFWKKYDPSATGIEHLKESSTVNSNC